MFVARLRVSAPLAAGLSPLARKDGYMPIKLKFARKDHGRRCRRRALRGLAVLLLLASTFPAALASAQARAREVFAIATPFEVGESPSGNYLAALVAGSERDTVAAATFFREALRSDPRNPNLIER